IYLTICEIQLPKFKNLIFFKEQLNRWNLKRFRSRLAKIQKKFSFQMHRHNTRKLQIRFIKRRCLMGESENKIIEEERFFIPLIATCTLAILFVMYMTIELASDFSFDAVSAEFNATTGEEFSGKFISFTKETDDLMVV